MTALARVEATLAETPDSVNSLFDKARLLTLLGKAEAARQAYLDLLAIAPTHFAALNNLGSLMLADGFRTAARTTYEFAIEHHPDNPDGHVNLGNLLLAEGELASAKIHFEAALALDSHHYAAHQGLAHLLTSLGDDRAAESHRRAGFTGHSLMVDPFLGSGQPIPILLLVSAKGGDVPIRQFIDRHRYQITIIVADYFGKKTALPEHKLVVNAIGDADICQPALRAAQAFLRTSNAPVINPPTAIMQTGRIDNAKKLGRIAGVVTPKMVLLQRDRFLVKDSARYLEKRGLTFPFLLRTPGFHAGQNFLHVADSNALAEAVSSMPGQKLLAIQFINTADANGKFCKYRVMFVNGQLFPLHAALSDHWKVHYFSADMAENPHYRSFEQAFLENMSGVLGQPAINALAAIRDDLGLDYGGIDFSLTQQGKIILFEANATMVVNPPGNEKIWSYRQEPIKKVISAFQEMLYQRSSAR